MTTATATEVERRKGAPRKPRTLAGSLGVAFAAAALAAGIGAKSDVWPSPKYQADPVAFGREALGIEPWERQVEIAEAVRDHSRVAVASGHKVSKSHTAAWIALWFFCSFPDARVVMSSTTARQVDQILWREVRKMHARAVKPIGGEPRELARSGLKADDFREIVGFTAREAEAVAGISGANLLYILDEASGIPDVIFEAIEGNRAGGARLVMFSNPTRTEGEFFEAFNSKAQFYKTIRISSEETPNVREGRVVVPGLATREWVEEKRLEWGPESPLYKIRVRGEFVLAEDGKILSVHAISQAEARWDETPADGRLFIGVDPAGPGEGGDESAFALRRGQKVLGLFAFRALTEGAHLAHALGFIAEHRSKREPPPVVVIDREGPIGTSVLGIFRSHLERHPGTFELVAVRASDRASRQPHVYDRVRDELWANLESWIREGGAVPEDAKLAKELHAPSWEGQITGRLKATPKIELRKSLGRSPDRADAVALAVWEPTSVRVESARDEAREAEEDDGDDDRAEAGRVFDPYGGAG